MFDSGFHDTVRGAAALNSKSETLPCQRSELPVSWSVHAFIKKIGLGHVPSDAPSPHSPHPSLGTAGLRTLNLVGQGKVIGRF